MDDTYLAINNEQVGPYSLERIQQMLGAGEISNETLYAKEGMQAWEPVASLFAMELVVEPPLPAPVIDPNQTLERCRNRAAELAMIFNYKDAADWVAAVNDEYERLPNTVASIDQIISNERFALADAQKRFTEQGFFKRAFADHSEEARIQQRITALTVKRDEIKRLVHIMHGKAHTVPLSKGDRDRLIKELKLFTKELKLKKKEAAIAMTEIRKQARVASHNAGVGWLGFYDSSLAANERRHIRQSKDEMMRPYEDEKGSIEVQLLTIEEHILWLEKFP